ncbi:YkgJ family cysteine cluster protein [Thiolapillus sp.]
MSDEKFDIPFKSPTLPTVLGPESKLRFSCHKGISCFNACCKKSDITLVPYDVLRLKKHLGMTSEEFLNAHTVPYPMDQDQVPGLKMKTDETGACLFLDPENGCTVYEDRPTVCRYYPLAVLNIREKDSSEPQTQYSLVVEAHCKGHEEDRELTVEEYRREQGCDEFDFYNQEWYELILKKKSAGPGVGKPSEMSLQLFFMASYNSDMFRRFVLSDKFRASYDIPEETYEQIEKDDVALLQFGYKLMRQALFGEKIIPEKPGVWEKRVAERREIWEARTQAEIEARNKKVEEQMREES